MPPYLLFIHLIIFTIMDISNLINGASSGASVGSQFGKTGTIVGAVAGGALGALSGSRDDKAYKRAKELAQLNNQMQREMVEDSAMLQKTGMKKAGLSVASLNGGFTPVNSPDASLPSFSTDAQMQSATTQGASALASLLQSNPVAEAQKICWILSLTITRLNFLRFKKRNRILPTLISTLSKVRIRCWHNLMLPFKKVWLERI